MNATVLYKFVSSRAPGCLPYPHRSCTYTAPPWKTYVPVVATRRAVKLPGRGGAQPAAHGRSCRMQLRWRVHRTPKGTPPSAEGPTCASASAIASVILSSDRSQRRRRVAHTAAAQPPHPCSASYTAHATSEEPPRLPSAASASNQYSSLLPMRGTKMSPLSSHDSPSAPT